MRDRDVHVGPDYDVDDGLEREPGWYASLDGLAIAGPAETKSAALRALKAWVCDEGYDWSAPTTWHVASKGKRHE